MSVGGQSVQAGWQLSSAPVLMSYPQPVPRTLNQIGLRPSSEGSITGPKYANVAEIPQGSYPQQSTQASIAFPLSSYSLPRGIESTPQVYDSMAVQQSSWNEVFDQLDINGDGIISKNEFEQFLQSQQVPPQTLNLGSTEMNQEHGALGSMQGYQSQVYAPPTVNFGSMQQIPTQPLNPNLLPYQSNGNAPSLSTRVEPAFNNGPTTITSLPPNAGASAPASVYYSSRAGSMNIRGNEPLQTRQFVSSTTQPTPNYLPTTEYVPARVIRTMESIHATPSPVVVSPPHSNVSLGDGVPTRIRRGEDYLFPSLSLGDFFPVMNCGSGGGRDRSGEPRPVYTAPVNSSTPVPTSVLPVAGAWSRDDIFGDSSSIPRFLFNGDLPPITQTDGLTSSQLPVTRGQPFNTGRTSTMDVFETGADVYGLPVLLSVPSGSEMPVTKGRPFVLGGTSNMDVFETEPDGYGLPELLSVPTGSAMPVTKGTPFVLGGTSNMDVFETETDGDGLPELLSIPTVLANAAPASNMDIFQADTDADILPRLACAPSVPTIQPYATRGISHMDIIEPQTDPKALPQMFCAPSVVENSQKIPVRTVHIYDIEPQPQADLQPLPQLFCSLAAVEGGPTESVMNFNLIDSEADSSAIPGFFCAPSVAGGSLGETDSDLLYGKSRL